MKIFLIVLFFLITLPHSIWGSEFSYRILNALPDEQKAITNTFNELNSLLPEKFINGVPLNLNIKIEKIGEFQTIPQDLCENKQVAHPFVYAQYSNITKTLTLNKAVVAELIKGPLDSKIISCQHKTLYAQARASLVHELAHSFDFSSKLISSTPEFLNRVGIERGLLKEKNRNNDSSRSVDPYEFKNAAEAFAVNAEYYLLDPEFSCRRPALNGYLKTILGASLTSEKNCSMNHLVMKSTNTGLYPVKIEPQRLYRVDYLLASPGKDLSSGFGHSMFRLVLCAPEHIDLLSNKKIPATPYGPKCLNDKMYHLVVSYRANIEDATLNYLKGLVGGYPSMMFILNFSDVLDEYNRDELRDVVSYPLKLTDKEKIDFLNKVLEDHWSYRGSYKFITNNCAVESYQLLKSSLDRPDLREKFSVSPKGVLKDLDELTFLSSNNSENEKFTAHTDFLEVALKAAYKISANNPSKQKDLLKNFIRDSKSSWRKNTFLEFTNEVLSKENFHDELSSLNKRVVTSSSFSLIEQQILRNKILDFRKKAIELFLNSKDENIKSIVQLASQDFTRTLTEVVKSGYGVPSESEVLSRDDIEVRMDSQKEMKAKIEIILQEKLPQDLSNLKSIENNIAFFNKYSLSLRENYRSRLDLYIQQVLKNLLLEDSGRELLLKALDNTTSLDKVRSLLDISLVSKKEILDLKLRKIISELLD